MLSFGMSGLGHGWNSSLVSGFSVFGAPVSGVAWGLRGGRLGQTLGGIALAGGLFLDWLLWRETLAEGSQYASDALDRSPGFVLLWAVLFAAWQLLAALVLVGRQHRLVA